MILMLKGGLGFVEIPSLFQTERVQDTSPFHRIAHMLIWLRRWEIMSCIIPAEIWNGSLYRLCRSFRKILRERPWFWLRISMYLRTKNSYMPRTEDGTESPPITAMQMDNSVCVAGISAAENGRAIFVFRRTVRGSLWRTRILEQ